MPRPRGRVPNRNGVKCLVRGHHELGPAAVLEQADAPAAPRTGVPGSKCRTRRRCRHRPCRRLSAVEGGRRSCRSRPSCRGDRGRPHRSGRGSGRVRRRARRRRRPRGPVRNCGAGAARMCSPSGSFENQSARGPWNEGQVSTPSHAAGRWSPPADTRDVAEHVVGVPRRAGRRTADGHRAPTRTGAPSCRKRPTLGWSPGTSSSRVPADAGRSRPPVAAVLDDPGGNSGGLEAVGDRLGGQGRRPRRDRVGDLGSVFAPSRRGAEPVVVRPVRTSEHVAEVSPVDVVADGDRAPAVRAETPEDPCGDIVGCALPIGTGNVRCRSPARRWCPCARPSPPNCDRSTCWPRPVRSRCSSAARTAVAACSPATMSPCP